jgi:hypothetical protein
MRTFLLGTMCAAFLGVCAYLTAEQQPESVAIRIKLVDVGTGQAIPGIVRVFSRGSEKPLPLPGLYPRLRGLGKAESDLGWHVLPAAGAIVALPAGGVKIEAVSGLESALGRLELDLAGKPPAEAVVKLPVLFRPDQLGLVAGNTHLHLKNMTLDQAGEYIRTIPAADNLKVLFISYLERFKDDETYITNRYPPGDQEQFTGTGVLVNNGEEYRHNFKPFGQGYGHVMFLNIRQHIKPASLGPGITGSGQDDTPLQGGIANARQQGGTIIWCHNTNGYEATPQLLAGRLDALNVFDGSRSGQFEDRYYLYLNVGRRLPISTGTDWFMYDFSRVYAKATGKLRVSSWLDAVKAGRTVATNGPLLTLTVDGKAVGDILNLEKPKSVTIEAAAIGRVNFHELQLVHNGKVIHKQAAEPKGEGFAASLKRGLPIDEPGWLAVRIDTRNRNELGQQLFAHSSPVWLDLAGQRVCHIESARTLLKQLEEARADIRMQAKFSSDGAAGKLLAVYDAATDQLTKEISLRGKR